MLQFGQEVLVYFLYFIRSVFWRLSDSHEHYVMNIKCAKLGRLRIIQNLVTKSNIHHSTCYYPDYYKSAQ